MGIVPLGALERIPSLVAYRELGRKQETARDDPAGRLAAASTGDTAAA